MRRIVAQPLIVGAAASIDSTVPVVGSMYEATPRHEIIGLRYASAMCVYLVLGVKS